MKVLVELSSSLGFAFTDDQNDGMFYQLGCKQHWTSREELAEAFDADIRQANDLNWAAYTYHLIKEKTEMVELARLAGY